MSGSMSEDTPRTPRQGDYDRLIGEDTGDADEDDEEAADRPEACCLAMEDDVLSNNGDDGSNDGTPIFVDDEQAGDGLYRDRPGSVHSSSNSTSTRTPRWWNKTLLPDSRLTVPGVGDLVDGPPVVKLLKFLGVTLGAICLMYKFVRAVNWEHKESFTLERFWTYESTQVVSDTVVFFVVARLWKQRGVDHVAWLACLVVSNIFMSYLPNIAFLRQSFTLYDMHCRWSWKLWVFVLVLTPLVLCDVFLHVRHAVRRRIFVPKLVELGLAVVFWFLPYASSPYFHLHHWFAGWWIGMHANFDTWWSRATLAWCWGLYVNGIAAYGRDPVLTCGYALFLSKQNRCPFLDCYVDGIATPDPVTNSTTPVVQPMVKPDWRNCSANAYHP